MYNEESAEFVLDFIQCLKHTDGKWAGKPFIPMEWQAKAVREFYGTLKEDGYRKYEYLYLEIPKKNGKSELSAALGLYHTFADGEIRGEVYICAADKQNASIVFNVALAMIEQCPFLKKRAKIRESTKEIIDKETQTIMKVMSSEAFSKHGYKPSCVIFDELHAQPTRELWDVMTFGAGDAREQPVWIVLTTAGDDPDRQSIGWEIHKRARGILEFRKGNIDGNVDYENWLPFIWGMPDDPDECAKIDIFDPKTWYACNPSLGETLKEEKIALEAKQAKGSEAEERNFRWLRLNQWISTKTVGWLPIPMFDKSEKEIPLETLKGKTCVGGLDLSTTTDLTAFVLLFPPQTGLDTWYAIFKAWITEEKLTEREKRDHMPFREWAEKGYVEITPGNVIDFDFIEGEIVKCCEEYQVKMVGADPWLSRSISQHLEGVTTVVEIPQTMQGLSGAMKELEKLLRKRVMKHPKNPCARWCFGNVRCAVDGNENMKPMKNKSIGRIDIAVAWIISMAAWLLSDKVVDKNAAILDDNWSM